MVRRASPSPRLGRYSAACPPRRAAAGAHRLPFDRAAGSSRDSGPRDRPRGRGRPPADRDPSAPGGRPARPRSRRGHRRREPPKRCGGRLQGVRRRGRVVGGRMRQHDRMGLCMRQVEAAAQACGRACGAAPCRRRRAPCRRARSRKAPGSVPRPPVGSATIRGSASFSARDTLDRHQRRRPGCGPARRGPRRHAPWR